MIQTGVSGNRHTLLTQLLLTSLLPHSMSVKRQQAGVCQRHQVVMETYTSWRCEVDYQGTCHEPDDQQMVAKCLHQSLRLGISASYSRRFWIPRDGRWIAFDRLWRNLLSSRLASLSGVKGKKKKKKKKKARRGFELKWQLVKKNRMKKQNFKEKL